MRLEDDIDFTTLSWVKRELDETLNQARLALQAFVEDSSDTSQMRFCATYLHQVHGTLAMVELHGAAMVVEELELAAKALLDGEVEDRNRAFDVMIRGMVQLPDYLERLQSGHRDIPIVLLPLLNEVRAVREEPPLTEMALFAPKLDVDIPVAGPGRTVPDVKMRAATVKLRKAFEASLLGWLRAKDDPAAARGKLARMTAICDKLASITHSETPRRLWWIAASVLQGLHDGAVNVNREVKLAVGKIDQEMKRQAVKGERAMVADSTDRLSRQLLFVAATEATGGCERIDTLNELFNLALLMPDPSEVEHAMGSMTGHNRDLLDTVAGAIKEDLLRVKDGLDFKVRQNDMSSEGYPPLIEHLDKIADTLGMLGLEGPRNAVIEERGRLQRFTDGEDHVTEERLMDVASSMLYVEAALDNYIDRLGSAEEGEDEDRVTISTDLPSSEVRRILDALMKESSENLQEIKRKIVEFIEAPWDHERVTEAPRLLQEIVGALRMLDLTDAADLLQAVIRFIDVELLKKRAVPTAEQLDTLADAVASIEYFLEAVREHRPGRDKILDVARSSLDRLGYLGEAGERLAAEAAETYGEPEPEEADEPATLQMPAVQEVPEAVAGADTPRAPVDADIDDDIDEEIREVFIEEVEEELKTLEDLFPLWRDDPEDQETLATIRRTFHTLKGSGRLVGAHTIGEFSWQIENLLNRVLDGSREVTPAVLALMGTAVGTLPELLANVRGEGRPTADIEGIKQVAERLASGEEAELSAAPAAPPSEEPEAPVEAVVEEAATEEFEIDLPDDLAAELEAKAAEEDDADEALLQFQAEIESLERGEGLDQAAEAPTEEESAAAEEAAVEEWIAGEQEEPADGAEGDEDGYDLAGMLDEISEEEAAARAEEAAEAEEETSIEAPEAEHEEFAEDQGSAADETPADTEEATVEDAGEESAVDIAADTDEVGADFEVEVDDSEDAELAEVDDGQAIEVVEEEVETEHEPEQGEDGADEAELDHGADSEVEVAEEATSEIDDMVAPTFGAEDEGTEEDIDLSVLEAQFDELERESAEAEPLAVEMETDASELAEEAMESDDGEAESAGEFDEIVFEEPEVAEEEEDSAEVDAMAEGGGGGIDPVLLDILRSEVGGHLAFVEDYLHQYGQEGPALAVTEPLLRAVHTLNGAVAMVDVTPLTTVTAPLERYVKRLRLLDQAPSAEGAEALEASVAIVREVVAELEHRVPQFPDSHPLGARLDALAESLPEPSDVTSLFPVEEEPTGELEEAEAELHDASEDAAELDEIGAVEPTEALEESAEEEEAVELAADAAEEGEPSEEPSYEEDAVEEEAVEEEPTTEETFEPEALHGMDTQDEESVGAGGADEEEPLAVGDLVTAWADVGIEYPAPIEEAELPTGDSEDSEAGEHLEAEEAEHTEEEAGEEFEAEAPEDADAEAGEEFDAETADEAEADAEAGEEFDAEAAEDADAEPGEEFDTEAAEDADAEAGEEFDAEAAEDADAEAGEEFEAEAAEDADVEAGEEFEAEAAEDADAEAGEEFEAEAAEDTDFEAGEDFDAEAIESADIAEGADDSVAHEWSPGDDEELDLEGEEDFESVSAFDADSEFEAEAVDIELVGSEVDAETGAESADEDADEDTGESDVSHEDIEPLADVDLEGDADSDEHLEVSESDSDEVEEAEFDRGDEIAYPSFEDDEELPSLDEMGVDLEGAIADLEAEEAHADDEAEAEAERDVADEEVDELQDAEETGEAPVAATVTGSIIPTAEPETIAIEELGEMDAELLEIFVQEGEEILDEADHKMVEFRDRPTDSEVLTALQRELHTLKGGARMAGVAPIGDLSHSMESLFEAVVEGTLVPSTPMVELLEHAFDRLHQMLDAVTSQSALPGAAEIVRRMEAILAGEPVESLMEGAQPVAAPEEAADEAPAAQPEPAVPVAARRTALDEEMDQRGGVAAARPQQEMIRVRADLLDNLVNYAGEVSIYRARLDQQVGTFRFNLVELDQTVSRLRDQLRKLEIETEAQILSRYQREGGEIDADFDPLELDRFSQLQQYSRALAESVADLVSIQSMLDDITRGSETLLLQQSRVNSDLQEGLMRTRMVPFDSLVPRLRRILRQTSGELGKRALLRVEGAQGEMDRTVLERVTAPLEHMLRNAVAHGLESPEERVASGKSEEGTILVRVSREATEVVIRVIDDGAGINPDRVREKAIERGLLKADADLTERDLYGFILQSGFSTADDVSKIAGRGVGMDVVNSEIKQLGGSLDISSRRGEGTTFTIRLPFTLAVTHAIMVRIGDSTFAVPLSSIEGVVRMNREDFEQRIASGDAAYEYGGDTYQLHELDTLLGLERTVRLEDDMIPIIMSRIGDQRAGIRVDHVMSSREIVVKSVGPQVSSIPGIFGATILGDGSVIMILDLGPLIRRGAALRLDAAEGEAVAVAQPEAVEERPPLIMVVDDSITMRKVTTRVLERHEMEVITAKDGVDAVEQLQERIPDLMLLDIEMPRMDGYELATHMRNDIRLRDIPIIMITSRTGEKHRQRALEIGVNRYLGKPYQEADLLENVNELLEETVGTG